MCTALFVVYVCRITSLLMAVKLR